MGTETFSISVFVCWLSLIVRWETKPEWNKTTTKPNWNGQRQKRANSVRSVPICPCKNLYTVAIRAILKSISIGILSHTWHCLYLCLLSVSTTSHVSNKYYSTSTLLDYTNNMFWIFISVSSGFIAVFILFSGRYEINYTFFPMLLLLLFYRGGFGFGLPWGYNSEGQLISIVKQHVTL